MRFTNTFSMNTKAAVKLIKQIAFAERSCLPFPEAGKGSTSYCQFKEFIFQNIKLDLGMIRRPRSRESTQEEGGYIQLGQRNVWNNLDPSSASRHYIDVKSKVTHTQCKSTWPQRVSCEKKRCPHAKFMFSVFRKQTNLCLITTFYLKNNCCLEVPA